MQYVNVMEFNINWGCVLGQIVSPGSCPAHQTQMPFNPGQFISKSWFQIRRYPSPFEEGTECSTLDIVSSRSGISFNFRGVNSTDRSLTKAPGKAFFDYGQLSKLILEMPIESWNSSATIFHFWVISTDYKNYALVWSCDALCDEFKREQLWLLSREPTLNDDIWQDIKSRYFTNGPFKLEYMFQVNQDNCPKITKMKSIGMKSEFNVLSLIQFK